jgi:hypothetical protein
MMCGHSGFLDTNSLAFILPFTPSSCRSVSRKRWTVQTCECWWYMQACPGSFLSFTHKVLTKYPTVMFCQRFVLELLTKHIDLLVVHACKLTYCILKVTGLC